MFTRAFNVAGLLVQIAEWKASLIGFAAKRSMMAMLGCLVATIVALSGLAVLLGAGYVAFEAIVGVPVAMAATGAFLLMLASLIWLIARQRGKSTESTTTEREVSGYITRDKELLSSMLGITNSEAEPTRRSGPRVRSSAHTAPSVNLESPMVLMAAGFALLGLLGPGRLLRTIRIATALASATALANRAISEHQDKRGTHLSP
jgi:hypothetical protein